jgi:hypothetical protein
MDAGQPDSGARYGVHHHASICLGVILPATDVMGCAGLTRRCRGGRNGRTVPVVGSAAMVTCGVDDGRILSRCVVDMGYAHETSELVALQ